MKHIIDKSAFEDAQLMAEIAYRDSSDSFWWAAMRTLKTAYGVK